MRVATPFALQLQVAGAGLFLLGMTVCGVFAAGRKNWRVADALFRLHR